MIDYGIKKCVVGDDNIESTFVRFGDGMTRISTVGWDNEAGLQLCRSEKLSNKPFAKFKPGEDVSPNDLPDDDKVYIVFDNPASIDVMIERLIEAKKMLVSENT